MFAKVRSDRKRLMTGKLKQKKEKSMKTEQSNYYITKKKLNFN